MASSTPRKSKKLTTKENQPLLAPKGNKKFLGPISRRQYLKVAGGTAAFVGMALATQKWEQVSAATEPIYKGRITPAERKAAAEAAEAFMENLPKSISSVQPADVVGDWPTLGPGDIPDYFSLTVPNWGWSPPLKKFIDRLPGLGPDNANTLGQYIPIATPDTLTYPGSDYYEIELREYEEKMHTNLPPTRLRGYVQTNYGTDGLGINSVPPDSIHYMGPLIIAQKDRAVRIRFTNALPIGSEGNLFIPVDQHMMGAGIGPMGGTEMFTQNRAVIHLHGADAPWVSDGTPHQWITPTDETTSYKEGLSVAFSGVPDMPDPGPGEYNYYYPNQISARLMFYHDHALGITRLNVYAGMAAPYLIQDTIEEELVVNNVIPTEQIPLVIQDRTFVDETMIATTDPTWNWGTTPGTPHRGDLWMGHVYVPAQHPYAPDGSGVNPMGRWHYSPWFWPPGSVEIGPQPNPYYDPNDPTKAWQGPQIPGTPHPAMQMESFQDTMIVNGTAFPYLEVDAKAYRFRILNASNDRFLNLQLYVADPGGYAIDTNGDFTVPGTGFGTEVKMVLASNYPSDPTWPDDFSDLGNPTWPTDGREGGVPDWNLRGPDWIAIGNEGGFLPAPAIVRQRPIDWNVDVTMFAAGLVNSFSLCLGPAERSDVIVDFKGLEGKTLILYNDAPAPYPAPDPRFDFYSNSPDMHDTGGYTYPDTHSTLPGFGPNTRTIMQIRVRDVIVPDTFDLTTLQEVWESNNVHQGVFERSQPPVLIPSARYNSAYRIPDPNNEGSFLARVNNTATSFPFEQYVRIFQSSHTFKTISGTSTGISMTLPLQPKAIQDEMGEAFDPVYGRMSGMLGLEMPVTIAGAQNFMLYPYASPPVELIRASMTPLSEPLPGDGTQIWKITHNGVDTHPIHFHLFNVQLINRVAWDGFLTFPHATELGWKETLRVSPLEDTIVALRPVAPQLPFKIPNSVRPIDSDMPLNEILTGPPGGFLDPSGNPVTVVNQMVNLGWEYVIHCHILGHEEMDMMHTVCFVVDPESPTNLNTDGLSAPSRVALSWTDNSANATGFVLERATDPSFTTNLVRFELPRVTTYVDTSVQQYGSYYYRVRANNKVGSTVPGFPQLTAYSGYSRISMGLPGATGLLRVQVNPPLQTTISANGTPRNSWALNWVKVPAGNYTLSFSGVQGYDLPTELEVSINGSTPVLQSITTPVIVNPNQVTVVNANFSKLGNLRVQTSPPLPATIFLNGHPADEWGFWADLPAGDYNVSFESIQDYITPEPVVATVTPDGTTNVTGTYTPGVNNPTPIPHGLLRVQTVPAVQTRIFVGEAQVDSWGLNWVKMETSVGPGTYTISFSEVTGFKTPTEVTVTQYPGTGPQVQSLNQPITILEGVVTEVIANFSQKGNLRIETSPPQPATVFINGQPADEWGAWLDIDPGEYVVSFQTMPDLITPEPLVVTVEANLTTHVVGNYSDGTTQVVP